MSTPFWAHTKCKGMGFKTYMADFGIFKVTDIYNENNKHLRSSLLIATTKLKAIHISPP